MSCFIEVVVVEDLVLDSIPNHQVPPPLEKFVSEFPSVDHDPVTGELFLYHGTNCYRRWEINRCGQIQPGRSNYSFYCTKPQDAYTYARAACLRDIGPGNTNSLICEPVVLKVKFTPRTWIQVDFIQENPDCPESMSVAVLGPVPFLNIMDVLHCTHGRRLGCGVESIRTFEDGSLMDGIRHLRAKLKQNRPDAWLLRKLGLWTQDLGVKIAGGQVPDLTADDYVRKLRQVRA